MIAADIRKIGFGYSSAEKEGTRAPDLLVRGYFDLHEVCADALDGDHFLVLGYKGSGKSAIGERLRLLHVNDSQKFIHIINLEDFPYATFTKIVGGPEAPQTRYPTAWSWILLIYMLASIEADAGITTNFSDELEETLSALRQMGLLPIIGLRRLVRTTTERNFKLTIPKFFEGSWKQQDAALELPQYVDNLKRLFERLRTDSRHLLVIDGLDEIVTSQTAQWDSLGSLVFEVNRLNKHFEQSGFNGKILLLCRTDIFELLESPNKNKIRQDSAIELDWYEDPSSADRSMLIRVANIRAGLAIGRSVDIFQELFPKSMFAAPTKKVLLDSTRHTPRDFLQLLKQIQSVCTGYRATYQQVRSGIRKYSTDYFLPEMLDELDGYIAASSAKEFFRLIAMFRSRVFFAKATYALAAREKSSLSEPEIDTILKALFECSAIGNIEDRTKGPGFVTFRFRNRHASFNIGGKLYLHRGLWYALNLPVHPQGESEEVSSDSPQVTENEQSASKVPQGSRAESPEQNSAKSNEQRESEERHSGQNSTRGYLGLRRPKHK